MSQLVASTSTWPPVQGFGFLSSIASQQLFGKDVFAMKSQLGDVGVGTQARPGFFHAAPLPHRVLWCAVCLMSPAVLCSEPLPSCQVQFKAAMSERGPVASECQVLGGGMPGMGMMMPGMQQWPGMGMQQWPGMGMQPGMGMPGMGMQKSAKPDEAGHPPGIQIVAEALLQRARVRESAEGREQRAESRGRQQAEGKGWEDVGGAWRERGSDIIAKMFGAEITGRSFSAP